MFENSYILIAIISILIILSYIYSAISLKTKIPSVLLLIITGIVARFGLSYFGYELPKTTTILEIFGIIGLILIVLEGTLELKLAKDKLKLIGKSFFSALVILVVTALLIASGIKLIYNDFTFRVCFVNAIPMAVISSAIAIPSVGHFLESKKEFIIYESIFSDILGILLFNIVVENSSISFSSASWIFVDFFIVIAVSVAFTAFLILFIDKAKTNIKFFLLISILILLYGFGKMVHLSSLLLILIFGLLINNIDIIGKERIKKYVDYENINISINQFKVIINESAFLIRTFFFFIFGFSLHLAILLNFKIIITGIIIVLILYGVRYLYLKYFTRRNLFPELYVAPRGLITILLFYSIPEEFSIGIISEGVLFFVILVTSLIMMMGLVKKKYKIPEMEIYVGNEKIK
ncbi:MAG: cation:proton antiporter [Bacteroidales bacterium]|nr:cation:proton antiporter [Bacteroidales bacterium]